MNIGNKRLRLKTPEGAIAMSNNELSISVGELLGVIKVSLSGQMCASHDQAVLGILSGFRDQGATSLVLDIVGLQIGTIESATSLINVLRSLGPMFCVHVVASDSVSSILRKGNFGNCIRLYSSLDDLADHVGREEFLTSRWMAQESEDNELPIAA